MANSAAVRELAMALADVTEKPCYGTPAFYVKRKLFARLLEDDGTCVIKMNQQDRKQRIAAMPDTFFVTDHYRNHPMVIVRLATVSRAELGELLAEARALVLG